VRKTVVFVAMALFVAAVGETDAQSLSPEDSLRLTHDAVAKGVREGNFALLQGLIHPQALGFFWDSQMLVEMKAGFGPTEALAPVIADLSRFTSTPSSTTYRAIGDTGVVCMTSTRVPMKGEKPNKGEKLTVRYNRLTYVYVRSGDNWKLISWHTSETPLKR